MNNKLPKDTDLNNIFQKMDLEFENNLKQIFKNMILPFENMKDYIKYGDMFIKI